MTLVTNMRNHIIFALLVFAVCINVQIYAQTDTTSVPLSDSAIIAKDTIEGGKDTAVMKFPSSTLTSKVKYSAEDSIRFDLKERMVYLYYKAIVEYENMKLEADFITVDFDANEVIAVGVADSAGKMQGEPVFTLNDDKYNAREMKYNFKTKRGTSKGVMLVEAEGFIRADKVYKDSNNVSFLKGVTYTTCTHPEPHFHIQSDKFKVIPEKQVICGPANLVVAGVNTPVVIPFGFFPISKERSRGIIPPGAYGESDQRGFFIQGFGYYLPIGEHLDLQLTGDVSFRGSYGFHFRTAYRKRYKYNGNFTFDYNYNEFGEKESPDYRISKDYRVVWNYNKDSKARPGSSFNAKVNYVTKDQQRNNSRDVDDIVSTNANSNINYARSLLRNKLNLTVNARADQNLSNGDVDLDLPNVNLNLNRMQPFSKLAGPRKKYQMLRNLGFGYTMSFQNKLKFNQDSIFKPKTGSEERSLDMDALTDFSNGIRHTIPVATSFKAFQYFNISPSVSFTDYWYVKTIRKTWTGDTLLEKEVPGFARAGTYGFNVSLSTVIYGMHYSKKKGRKINAIRHVVTPTISANYKPDFTAVGEFGNREVQIDESGRKSVYSIFEDGIAGRPSGQESGSLDLRIGNNLEMKVLSKRDTTNGGIKKVKLIESFSMSSGYDFLKDSLQIRNISLSGNTTLVKVLRMNFSGSLDPYSFQYNDSLKRNVRIQEYELTENQRVGRFTNIRFGFSTNLNPEARKKFTSSKGTEQELEVINNYREYFVDFSIPWSLNLSYTYSMSRQFDEKAVKNQTIQFNGDLKLTENWKIALSSGYNFTQKELLITKIDFFRNLHCWEFSFGWIPAGQYRQFDFVIRVKAQVLQDLKLSRKGFWYDDF